VLKSKDQRKDKVPIAPKRIQEGILTMEQQAAQVLRDKSNHSIISHLSMLQALSRGLRQVK
jgi:hypothetical protein